MNKIWVVEMWEGGRWEPTVGVGLSRNEAKIEKSDWEARNPDEQFRVRKYKEEASGE